jgi:archaellum biogenesis protein FlaJ (TadC family)
MAGSKSRRKPSRRQELEELLGKMETLLESEEFEKLNALADKFEQKLELAIKEGSLDSVTLKKFLEVLKHLEEKTLKVKEKLKQNEAKVKRLKSYGDFA